MLAAPGFCLHQGRELPAELGPSTDHSWEEGAPFGAQRKKSPTCVIFQEGKENKIKRRCGVGTKESSLVWAGQWYRQQGATERFSKCMVG